MPCRDGCEDEYIQRNNLLVAALCGILSAHRRDGDHLLLDKVDWKEAGVTRKFVEEWWEEHKKQDRLRRKREREYLEERRKRDLEDLARLEQKYRGKSGKL